MVLTWERVFNPYLSYNTSNTSTVVQDTNSPDIRQVGVVDKVNNVCVVVGHPNAIATALDSFKSVLC